VLRLAVAFIAAIVVGAFGMLAFVPRLASPPAVSRPGAATGSPRRSTMPRARCATSPNGVKTRRAATVYCGTEDPAPRVESVPAWTFLQVCAARDVAAASHCAAVSRVGMVRATDDADGWF